MAKIYEPSSDHWSVSILNSEGVDLEDEACGIVGVQSHVLTIWRFEVDLMMTRLWWAVAMNVVPGEYTTIDEWYSCEKS